MSPAREGRTRVRPGGGRDGPRRTGRCSPSTSGWCSPWSTAPPRPRWCASSSSPRPGSCVGCVAVRVGAPRAGPADPGAVARPGCQHGRCLRADSDDVLPRVMGDPHRVPRAAADPGGRARPARLPHGGLAGRGSPSARGRRLRRWEWWRACGGVLPTPRSRRATTCAESYSLVAVPRRHEPRCHVDDLADLGGVRGRADRPARPAVPAGRAPATPPPAACRMAPSSWSWQPSSVSSASSVRAPARPPGRSRWRPSILLQVVGTVAVPLCFLIGAAARATLLPADRRPRRVAGR